MTAENTSGKNGEASNAVDTEQPKDQKVGVPAWAKIIDEEPAFHDKTTLEKVWRNIRGCNEGGKRKL